MSAGRAGSLGIAVLVVAVALTACSTDETASDATGTLTGTAVSGPTCPVEPTSGEASDEACADMPLAEAGIVVVDDQGNESMHLTTGLDGTFTADVVPGAYRLIPQPVAGMLGTPEPVPVTVAAGEVTRVDAIVYDTGIR